MSSSRSGFSHTTQCRLNPASELPPTLSDCEMSPPSSGKLMLGGRAVISTITSVYVFSDVQLLTRFLIRLAPTKRPFTLRVSISTTSIFAVESRYLNSSSFRAARSFGTRSGLSSGSTMRIKRHSAMGKPARTRARALKAVRGSNPRPAINKPLRAELPELANPDQKRLEARTAGQESRVPPHPSIPVSKRCWREPTPLVVHSAKRDSLTGL